MFIWYLVSIVFWMAVINFCIHTNAENIVGNGWVNGGLQGTAAKSIILLISVSAIPIFRLAVLCSIIYMSKHTKEEYEEWKNTHMGDDM